MSQEIIRLTDYKGRAFAEAYVMADGGVTIDFDNETTMGIFSRESTDKLLKLLLADRRERGDYRPHIGSFAGDF